MDRSQIGGKPATQPFYGHDNAENPIMGLATYTIDRDKAQMEDTPSTNAYKLGGGFWWKPRSVTYSFVTAAVGIRVGRDGKKHVYLLDLLSWHFTIDKEGKIKDIDFKSLRDPKDQEFVDGEFHFEEAVRAWNNQAGNNKIEGIKGLGRRNGAGDYDGDPGAGGGGDYGER